MKTFVCPHCKKAVKTHKCVVAIIYCHKCGKISLKKEKNNEKP